MAQREKHRTQRIGWLRAAVLGANDGIVSTASLVIGVAAADASRGNIMIAGVAGLVAGAMSMAAGEYVSVSSQADTEGADLDRERAELRLDVQGEQRELAAIYVGRGVDAALAIQVAEQLMARDALGAHARDELGISAIHAARPVQSFENRDVVTQLRKVARAGQARRPAADNGDLLPVRRSGLAEVEAVFARPVPDVAFEFTDGDGVAFIAENAELFALGFLRAHSAADRRQQGVLLQDF